MIEARFQCYIPFWVIAGRSLSGIEECLSIED
jgi:hypothetical protein